MPSPSLPETEHARLRHFRLACDMTLSEAAHKSGLSKSEISKLESGARRIRADHLHRLARIYGAPAHELAGPSSALTALLGSNGATIRAAETNGGTLPVFSTNLLARQHDNAQEISRVSAPLQLRGDASAYAVEVTDMS